MGIREGTNHPRNWCRRGSELAYFPFSKSLESIRCPNSILTIIDAADVWLTVPAAWDAKGCEIMREAAIAARLVQASSLEDAKDDAWKDRLHIITCVRRNLACSVVLTWENSFLKRTRSCSSSLRASHEFASPQAKSELYDLRCRWWYSREFRAIFKISFR